MCYQEKRSIVSAISSILIFTFYSIYIYQNYLTGNIDYSHNYEFWGSVILIFLPVMIVANIIIHIVFIIINKIATDENVPERSDEMDKIIELKSTRNSHYTFMVGILISMTALVIGYSPMTMFIAITSSMLVACVIGDISQLYFIRRGI